MADKEHPCKKHKHHPKDGPCFSASQVPQGVQAPDRLISGLQLGLVDKGSRSIGEWVELLQSAYVEATVDGALELGLLATKFPTLGSGQWLDLGPRPLPLSRTRFNIPAFVYLNYRFVAQK